MNDYFHRSSKRFYILCCTCLFSNKLSKHEARPRFAIYMFISICGAKIGFEDPQAKVILEGNIANQSSERFHESIPR